MSSPTSTRKAISVVVIILLVVFVVAGLFMENHSIRDRLLTTLAPLEMTSTVTSHVLPDWRMTTDCSAYGRDCVLRKLNEQTYAEYPFRFAKEDEDRYEWQSELPQGWRLSLEENVPSNDGDVVGSKPKDSSIESCVKKALQRTVQEQLDRLLKTLERNTEVDMIAFTISDYSYTKDMMQDVFEMAHKIVDFQDAFFMVAMDIPSMELACQHDLPFLAWPQETTTNTTKDAALKLNVANTKFDISYELVKRRQSFFFFEMDVWFVKSPIPVLKEQTVDILFSGHQNNPESANIGVYSIIANEASEEYLRICVEIMEQSPDTHDQVIMQQVYYFLDNLKAGKPLVYHGFFGEPHPKIPTFEHPATHGRFVPFQVVADERPVASAATLAIHTLCGAPLRDPHGKKMIAKELGAWYGSGSYYGRGNRYLWLDGHTWNGFSTAMSWPGFHPFASYHRIDILHWNVAATIALARRTNRIWVMPKIMNSAGVHFIWTALDMSSVEALHVDVRETNFPVNPKAWHSASVPFHPVARTAVGGDDGKIYAQLAADTSTGSILAWNSSTYHRNDKETSPFDAWFAIHTAIPELVEAEVLLAGLPATRSDFDKLAGKVRSKAKLSIAESEIVDVWRQLKWCWHDHHGTGLDDIVGRTPADWDCYLKGEPVPGAVEGASTN